MSPLAGILLHCVRVTYITDHSHSSPAKEGDAAVIDEGTEAWKLNNFRHHTANKERDPDQSLAAAAHSCVGCFPSSVL
jgi:hypothetical protein